MTWIDVPVAGQTYIARNKRQSNQETTNFYPHISKDDQARSVVSLEPIPGNKVFATAGSKKNRGAIKHNNLLFVVNGQELYSIDSAGTATLIGNIQGFGRVQMDTDGTNLVIVTGGIGYLYNGSLSIITDGDFLNARTVSYFNDRFIYDTPTGWCASEVGDPSTISSVNCAAIVSTKDAGGGALGVFSVGEKFYPFSETTIESWYNPGGEVNFARESFAFDIGVAGPYAVDFNSNFAYLLGSDRIPYRFSGLSKVSLGNQAIGQELQGYTDIDDCKVICQTWDNDNFVWYIFPKANRTWLLHEESNTWWRVAGNLSKGRHAINNAVDIYGKKIICDYNSNNIYQLDWDTYLNNASPMYWERITAPITYKTLGLRPARLFFQGVRVVLETGIAPPSGQGATPQLMLSWSVDNGNSYIGEIMLDCGGGGDMMREVVYQSGLGFIDPNQNIQFKLRMTDPQRWAISDMQVNVEAGI